MSVLTDEQFKAEVARREQEIRDGKAEPVGCITCGVGATTLAGQRASGIQ
jgi:hypothetical protein